MPSPIMKYFTYIETTPEKREEVQRLRDEFKEMAEMIERDLPDGPEKSVALRKLIEAKDAAVRAIL